MTVKEVVLDTRRQLAESGVTNPAFEAACLFEKHTGIRRYELPGVYDKPDGMIPPAYFTDVKRRLRGEPLQYILGKWEFMGLEFTVGPGVLIPRPDTEILAESALNYLKNRKNPQVLELCFGSGCIGISLAALHRGCTVHGVEISPAAIAYAKENIRLYGLEDCVFVHEGDMLEGKCADLPRQMFDLIICNPPYIPRNDIETLDVSVRGYEPLNALEGGEDGLDFYRAVFRWLPLLSRGGMAAFEVGIRQAEDVSGILARQGLRDLVITKDYAGIERVVAGCRRESSKQGRGTTDGETF